MIPSYVWECMIILMLILANGFFAGAEIAIIAARRSRLKQMADEGDAASRIALALADDPNRFLPTVQLGITLVSTFAAAFGGVEVVIHLQAAIEAYAPKFMLPYKQSIALTTMVIVLTFFSVLFGELIPKQLALKNAVRLARIVSRPMSFLSYVGRPFVWFMGFCTAFLLKLMGVRAASAEQAVSVEDIEHMILTGTDLGVLEPAEQRLAMGALRLGERSARDIMRPRIDIDALDIDTPAGEILGAIAMAGFSRVPIYEGNLDHIVGFVHIKDVMRRHYLNLPFDLRKLLHPPIFVPETLPLDRLLVTFQEKSSHLAVVLDEFGGTEGLITLQDVLEELVGEIRDEHRRDDEQHIVVREDGTILIDGAVSLEKFLERLNLEDETLPQPRSYSTTAGLLLSLLERIPKIGDKIRFGGYEIEVVDMDGKRIDRLLVKKLT